MSLIQKIVDLVERNENADARKNILKLNKDIKSYRDKVRQYIASNYADFLPSVINNEVLLEEGKYHETQLLNLRESLSDGSKSMYQANDEISRLVEELEVVNMKLNTSMKLMKIDGLLEKIKLYNESGRYTEINHLLNAILLIVNDPEENIIRRLDIYNNLKSRLTQERENMLKNLEARFKSFVDMKEKSFLKNRLITMTITKNTSSLIECVNSIVDSDYEFNPVVNFFMKKIFEAVVSRPISLEINDSDSEIKMTLSYSIEPVTDDLRPNYSVVFKNLRSVLQYLNNMNVQLQNEEFLLTHIFRNHQKEFLDIIFTNCLMHSVPKTFEEKNQSTISSDISEMSEFLKEINFCSNNEEDSLERYSDKIDELFYNQFTKNIQTSASEILKRDLHDMIHISEDTTLSTTTPLTFPRSMVSKSTLELIRLLEKILNQAKTATDKGDEKKNLMLSIRKIIENYAFTVQIHHSKFMSKIPQQSALFYNNCMYVSNWVTNCIEVKNYEMEQAVHDLQQQGWEVLECQIAKQKIQLLEILGDFDPSKCLNEILPEHFKPIRQCLRQMELLKNVWQTILPSDLYNKTMAGLLDIISKDLTKKVTTMEDISTILANALVDLIKTVDEKGQALFEADTSVFVIVTSWQTMLHLQFILDASLVDITNSWKSKEITQSFKAEEVKRLIRALFQNTDRRANALSSIV
ncbi:CLUMA_CG017017, isoform A [Clunio marinus]|uniref:CLUMA_CG017017, isoform A n=1 Tax=Clunio marinus TaxID=568069 RepID=A0A1J1IUN4_9DIPT|nr:CLUMA_CG017017, isoform A [Clunio marinus]